MQMIVIVEHYPRIDVVGDDERHLCAIIYLSVKNGRQYSSIYLHVSLHEAEARTAYTSTVDTCGFLTDTMSPLANTVIHCVMDLSLNQLSLIS